MIVSCPHCQGVVMRNPDGTCPTCHAPIELDAYGRPVPLDEIATIAACPRRVQGELIDDEYDDDQQEIVDLDIPPSHQAIFAFYLRLEEITPTVFVTPAIVAINVLVFVIMALTSGALLNPDAATLIAWGSNFGPQTLAGQWWRLVTCMFIHIGLIHLALNMWVLWDVGKLVERLVGNVGMLVLYFATGICGSLASVFWNPDVISAGASGAVFGVFGGLMGFMLYRTDSVPPSIIGGIRNSGFAFLVYNLVFGFSIPGIDMAAHLGGLGAGFVGGLLLSQSLDLITPSRRAMRNLVLGTVSGVVIVGAIFAAPQPPVDLRAALAKFTTVEKQVLDTFNSAVRRSGEGKLPDRDLAEIIQRDVLPPWHEQQQVFAAFENVPRRQREFVGTMNQYLSTRAEAWEILVEALETQNTEKARQYQEKQDIAQALLRKLNAQ